MTESTRTRTIDDDTELSLAAADDSRVQVCIRRNGTVAYDETLDKQEWPKPSNRRSIARQVADAVPDLASFEVEEALQELLLDVMLEDDSPLFPSPSSGTPVPVLSLLQLDDCAGPVRPFPAIRNLATDWPSTAEARKRLTQLVDEPMQDQRYWVLNAPTALGKSFEIATREWRKYKDVTGGEPVIQLSPTRDARDESYEKTATNGGESRALYHRESVCDIASGKFDDKISVDGQPASEWIDEMCDEKGLSFGQARSYLAEEYSYGCLKDDKPCGASIQWDDIPRTDDGDPVVDVVHATHQLVYVPTLRYRTNIVFDERPDFALLGPGATDGGNKENDTLTHTDVRNTITAYLREVDASLQSYEALVTIAQDVADDDQAADLLDDDLFERRPDYYWYFRNNSAHTLAPALAKAVWIAAKQDPDANGRRHGHAYHIPPGYHDEELPVEAIRTRVSVVLDETNTLTTVRNVPDMSAARSVIGLDAHPTWELWARNTGPAMSVEPILDREERRQWRRYERGLWVVQVGDATRPYSSGKYFDRQATKAFLQRLREHYDDNFRTAITASSVEDEVEDILGEVDVTDPETMHYGEEKSRGDFGDERIGAVLGSIDPGDDYVLDLLAELGLDAEPQRSNKACEGCGGDGCQECTGTGKKRARGREFVGSDAENAQNLLASVRENHVAQAVGRYARNADDSDDWALVFVRTNAMPDSLADFQVPGVNLYRKKQRAIMEYLQENPNATSREIADGVVEVNDDIGSCSKEHVRSTLQEQQDKGNVVIREGEGSYGADVHTWTGDDTEASVDLTPEEIANSDVKDTNTWELAIREATVGEQD